MSFKRSEFMGYLYDCILFEYAGRLHHGTSYNVDMDALAGCFEHIRQIYEDDENDEQLLEIPSDLYIVKHGMDEAKHIKNYILTLDKGCYEHFPHVVNVYDAEVSDNDSEEDDPYGYNSYYGYAHSVESSYGDDYITLYGFSGQEVQEFLEWYADEVPRDYHDEIAALIQGLRDDYWNNRGSGGMWETLPNGMRGATKFCANHNDNKRDKKNRRQREIKDAERRRREREEEETRQESERREQEQRRREEKERLAREQQEKELREETIRQRNLTITKYMSSLQVSLTPSQQRDDEVESLREMLQEELQDYFDDDEIEVHLFGSFASGLSTKSSDADFTVYYLPCDDISELADALRSIGYHDVSYINNARVPITTFYDPENGVTCDANIDQPMGVINSKLIATYRRIDNRFATLWFAVRQIAKKNNIISGGTGYLSSYALTMMLIVFLQDVTSPAILPRLQQQQSQRMTNRKVDGYDCSFDRNWSNYRTYGSDSPKCAGQLLIDFCYYYGYTFNYATKEVNACLGRIRNRSVTPPARSRRDRRPKDWPICILDPFITDRNVTGNCHRDAVGEIQECFQNAFDALKTSNINRAFRR
ncbi:hypothetical protein BGW39_005598 [Mortierella sp. 14UC]|nr:hypothetical protein BGW39_005598 [Mortierella sp. 14UC]